MAPCPPHKRAGRSLITVANAPSGGREGAARPLAGRGAAMSETAVGAEAHVAWHHRLWRWACPQGWGPTDVGWTLTIAWECVLIWIAIQPSSEPERYPNKFYEFANLKPSEMGDTLAGVFAVLAFVWIIVTVFLQSSELREQRNEFRQQREASQDMARAMAAQAAIFEDEMRGRAEQSAEKQARQLSEVLKSQILAIFSSPPTLIFSNGERLNFNIQTLINKKYSKGSQIKALDTHTLLSHFSEALDKISETAADKSNHPRFPELNAIKSNLKLLTESLEKATNATRLEFRYEDLLVLQNKFGNFLSIR